MSLLLLFRPRETVTPPTPPVVESGSSGGWVGAPRQPRRRYGKGHAQLGGLHASINGAVTFSLIEHEVQILLVLS